MSLQLLLLAGCTDVCTVLQPIYLVAAREYFSTGNHAYVPTLPSSRWPYKSRLLNSVWSTHQKFQVFDNHRWFPACEELTAALAAEVKTCRVDWLHGRQALGAFPHIVRDANLLLPLIKWSEKIRPRLRWRRLRSSQQSPANHTPNPPARIDYNFSISLDNHYSGC